MKKNRRLLIIILLISLISCLSFVYAEKNLPDPTREFYVGDFAGVLSSETKSWMINSNLNYEKTEEKPQIVVLTVPDLQGITIEEYAVAIFEKWKIGNKKYDNGVLVLLSVGDREIRIEVGYGLEGVIPDGRAGEIIRHARQDLSTDNYDEGLKKVFYLISQDVNNEYQYNNDEILGENSSIYIPDEPHDSYDGIVIPPIFKILGLLGILFLIWFDYRFLGGFIFGTLLRAFFWGGRGGRGGGHGGGFGSGGFGGSSGGGGRSGGGGASGRF